MFNVHLRLGAVLGAWALVAVLCAQSDERYAYVPTRAVPHTADDEGMGFRSTAVPGVLEMALPAGTERVDILNARGNVVRTMAYGELSDLDLGSLARGTWTLRAHTPHGFSIRRFVVMQPGNVAWAVPRQGFRK